MPNGTQTALATALTTNITTDSSGATSVGLTFSLPDHTFDFLAQGETLTVTYNVTVTDGTTSATRPIVFTVTAATTFPLSPHTT